MQYDSNEAEATALLFTDEKNGWLTGIKYGGLSPYRYTHLILHTKDQGRHWQDASEELRKVAAAKKQVAGDRINAGLIGVTEAESSGIKVITSDHEVFTTTDEAQSWDPPLLIDDKSEQAGIRRFGSKTNHKVWFLTSANSVEGIWSTLHVEQSQNSWTSFGLNGICLSDAIALSERHFVASGYVVNDDMGDRSDTHAVLLYTPDGGQRWSVVYRNKSVKAINSLHSLKPGVVMAVGANGLVLRLQVESHMQNR